MKYYVHNRVVFSQIQKGKKCAAVLDRFCTARVRHLYAPLQIYAKPAQKHKITTKFYITTLRTFRTPDLYFDEAI